MTPMTQRQKELIAKNVVAACKDIEKLNSTGYKFLNLCSGFIAHYDLEGFKAYYTEHNLQEDIERNAKPNQWGNFRPNDRDYEYYMSKRDCYNMILGRLIAKEFKSFMDSHFQIIHIS